MDKTFTVHLAENYPTEGMTDFQFAQECVADFLANREPLSVVDETGIVGVFYFQDLV